MVEIEDKVKKQEAIDLHDKEKQMLIKCKEELYQLKVAERKGSKFFLEFISENYVSYHNKKVVFIEKDFEDLKKTLRKT